MVDVFKSILLTISYSDQFQTPLTKAEIYYRQIKTKFSAELIYNSLTQLEKLGLVDHAQDCYFLKGRKDLLGIFNKRKIISLQKRNEITQFTHLISWLPWIKAAFLTGSVTQNNAKENDDLDFMIVCQNNRLWLARIVLMIITTMVGKRRSWQGEEENSWCLNLWLEEDYLSMPPSRRNIYTAFEVGQTELIYQLDDVGQKFFHNNLWMRKFLPQIKLSDKPLFYPRLLTHFFTGVDFVLSPLLFLLNYLAFTLQYSYMKPHKTREEVGPHKAFFHPRDTRGNIKENWKEGLRKLKI